MQTSKSKKKGPIPERTHWILRKMIRLRYAELCGTAPQAELAPPSTWTRS